MNTQERVIATIGEYSGIADVQMDHKFESDLQMDSLDKVEAVMAIEDAFDCYLEDSDISQCKTVADLVRLVQKTTGEVTA